MNLPNLPTMTIHPKPIYYHHILKLLLRNLLQQRTGMQLHLLFFYLELFYRPDGNQSNLRNAAYEALMEMIRHSAQVWR